MELRLLQYFLAVTREQNILRAAGALHLSQPTLSRQLRDMERELGKQLFIRGTRSITLTEEGMILRKRAEEILELVKKAEDEIALAEKSAAGNITVGAGETDGLRVLVRAVQALREECPGVHFHVVSGDKCSVIEHLDGGLIDFGVVFGNFDTSKYGYLRIPRPEHFGVLMRWDDLLADRTSIDPEELWDKPLIVSRQAICDQGVEEILGRRQSKLNIVGSYNLLYSGSLMVEEGMGYALAFDNIINTTGDSKLCFRPLTPRNETPMFVLWKKDQVFTKAAERFLVKLRGMEEGEYEMKVLDFKRGGKRIYGELYLPEGSGPFPAVILAHGFGGKCVHNRPYAEAFAKNGIAAYIFDFIGGGNDIQSDGKTTEMSVLTEAADMSAVLDGISAMEEIDSRNIFLSGQSQGGFVASYLAGTRPELVRGLVPIFPAYVLQDDAKKRTEGRELPETEKIMGLLLGRVYAKDAMSFDIYDVIKNYPGPVLLIHGTADDVVPIRYSQRAAEVFPSAKLIEIEGAGHGFFGAAEDRAVSLALDFVKENI